MKARICLCLKNGMTFAGDWCDNLGSTDLDQLNNKMSQFMQPTKVVTEAHLSIKISNPQSRTARTVHFRVEDVSAVAIETEEFSGIRLTIDNVNYDLDLAQLNALNAALGGDYRNKVSAIKTLREMTKMGLAEANDSISYLSSQGIIKGSFPFGGTSVVSHVQM